MSVVIINEGLLELALEKPSMQLYGIEQYPELYQKAAVLMESLTKLHVLSDGNKRCAMMTAEFMIEVNGGELILPLKSIRFAVDVAMDSDDNLSSYIKQWFKVHTSMNSVQLACMLGEHLREEAILKYFYDKGKNDEVEKILSDWMAFDTYPEHKEAWDEIRNRWEAHDKSGRDFNSASDKWKSIATITRHDIRPHLKEYSIAELNKDKLEYIKHLDDLENKQTQIDEFEDLAKDSENHDFQYRLGIMLKVFEKSHKALEFFKKLSKADPDNVDYSVRIADIYYFQLHKLEDAKTIYENIRKMQPDNKHVISCLGRVLNRIGKHVEAIQCFDQILEKNNSDQTMLGEKSQAHMKMKEFEQALHIVDLALKYHPQSHYLHIVKSKCLSEQKDYQKALDIVNKALKIKPNSLDLLHQKASVLSESKQYEEAISIYKKIIKESSLPLNAMIRLGIVLYNIDKPEKATNYLIQALEIDPDNVAALKMLIIVNLDMKNYDDVVHATERILDKNPNDAETIYFKSAAKLHQGKTLQSLDCLEKALTIDPTLKERVKNSKLFTESHKSKRFKKLIS